MMVDPILIEQVLMNLLKNAAEAIDNAALPASRRHIELRVVPKHSAELGGQIEFSVTDMGRACRTRSSPACARGLFLDQGRWIGHRPEGYAGPSSSRTRGGSKPRTSTMAEVVGCRFAFTIPVENSAGSSQPARERKQRAP